MRFTLAILTPLLVVALTLADPSLRAEDWKTTDGKVYQNVSIVKVEPDAVTILHQDGGGRIPMAQLPADLQARFHYDATSAQEAADARAQAESTQAQAEQMADQAIAAQNAKIAATQSSLTANPDSAASKTSPHYSIDDLVDSGQALMHPVSEPGHYSMNSLVDSAHTL